MHEEPIGILLSKNQWKNIHHKNPKEAYCFLYDKKAKELGLEVVFFTIDHITLNEKTAEVFKMENQSLVSKGTTAIPPIIYNPTKYNRKKQIKKMRELIQKENIVVINEQHEIKPKHFIQMMESHFELRPYIVNEAKDIETLFTIHTVGQKNSSHTWEIPYLYAKDLYENKYSLEQALTLYNQRADDRGITDQVMKISKKILKIISFYLPGIFEIGIQMTVSTNGDLLLKSTCTINGIVKDLQEWSPNTCKNIVEWPIEMAGKMRNRLLTQESSTSIIEQQHTEDMDRLNTNGKLINLKDHIKKHEDDKDILWVKFKAFQTNEPVIKLPKECLMSEISQLKILQFGIKEETCNFLYDNTANPINKSSYNEPIEIYISDVLVKKMHIPLDIKYQLKTINETAVIGPTIGLLLGEKNQMYNVNYMQKYSDRFGKYEKFGGLAIAFSSRSIDWEEKLVYGMIYDPNKKNWRYDTAPIPLTMYRRNFHQNKESIKRLQNYTNNGLFNSHHFKKSDLYQMQEDSSMQNHLPKTFLLKKINGLVEFIQEEKKIILKPVSLSRGRGIFIIESGENPGEYILYDYSNRKKVCHYLKNCNELEETLTDLSVFKQEYLFQTYIPLLKIDGCPFDVRVVMQKYGVNKWKCSGMECRVAVKDEDLTNIARGGMAITLDYAILKSGLNQSYPSVHKNILKLCNNFCHLIDQGEEHFAEFGIDIALDKKGYPWLLEANIFPSFKGFKVMDYENYLNIRYQPLFYATRLQGFEVVEEKGIIIRLYNESSPFI